MSKRDKIEKDEASPVTKITFTKSNLLKMGKFRRYADVLAVILNSRREYTCDEVRQAIDKFLEKEIK